MLTTIAKLATEMHFSEDGEAAMIHVFIPNYRELREVLDAAGVTWDGEKYDNYWLITCPVRELV